LLVHDFNCQFDDSRSSGLRVIKGVLTLENQLPIYNRLKSVTGKINGKRILLHWGTQPEIIQINRKEEFAFHVLVDSLEDFENCEFYLTVVDTINRKYEMRKSMKVPSVKVPF